MFYYCIIQICAVRSFRGPAGEYQASGCIDETVSITIRRNLKRICSRIHVHTHGHRFRTSDLLLYVLVTDLQSGWDYFLSSCLNKLHV